MPATIYDVKVVRKWQSSHQFIKRGQGWGGEAKEKVSGNEYFMNGKDESARRWCEIIASALSCTPASDALLVKLRPLWVNVNNNKVENLLWHIPCYNLYRKFCAHCSKLRQTLPPRSSSLPENLNFWLNLSNIEFLIPVQWTRTLRSSSSLIGIFHNEFLLRLAAANEVSFSCGSFEWNMWKHLKGDGGGSKNEIAQLVASRALRRLHDYVKISSGNAFWMFLTECLAFGVCLRHSCII